MENLKTKFFLDSGDPAETREALLSLGKLDGQTTNPSLIAKNPNALGKKFNKAEVWAFYKNVASEISKLIPHGSISIEVYADLNTPFGEMVSQAREFNGWIPNAHIKLPITAEGLKAAEILIKENIKLNITLVFNQAQAAAVHKATMGAKKGEVYLSPFIGRLDDVGEKGTDLIKNILQMYSEQHSHVEVLAASVRNLDHMRECLNLGADIITAPLKVLKQWKANEQFAENGGKLKSILYEQIDIHKPWQECNIKHALTDKGLEQFARDWNGLIEN